MADAKIPVVLVIDDSDVDRHVMAQLLVGSGFVVHELPTAIGATRMARQFHAGVVVVDQNLPALDGAKLAMLFRDNPSMKDVRIVLISSNDELTMTKVAREARVDAFVSKSRMHTDLVPTIKRVLGTS
jgi:CheY-like chemotaxis protein